MSLWSPVDLVTGSVPPHSNSLSSQNAKDESSSVNHSNESGSKLTGNRAHRSSNLPHSDHSNGSSSSVHNQASVSPNSLVMSSRRPANIPRAHSGSNLTHNPHSNEGHNKLSPSSSSSSSKDNKNQQGISAKRRRVDQFLEQKTGHVFQGKSALSDPNEPMPLQLVKSQRRHGPDVCDIPKEESESAKASSRHDEDDAPLNLCVKPSSSSSSATHSRTTESRRSEMSSRANNALRAHASYPASHSLHAELLSLAGVQPDSAAYPRKRGRRPKSLLAATNSVSSLSVAPPVMPALQEKPKKKRGRPPLYSPPPNIVIGNRLIPGALPTTQLQPGWPTFTPSGQIVFPSKSNGNSSAMSASHQSRPNVRKPSETETDDDSDVSSRPDYKEGVTQEDIRLPLRFGWKRHTIMKQLGTSGVKGEILYFSPDGKKVKSQQEVVRYLAKYNNGVVNKDNFSFSSHWLVGEFIEPGQGGRDPMILSESEIINRIDQLKRMKRKKGNSSLPKETASKSRANRQRDSTDTDASTSHLHDSIFSRLHGMVGLTPEDLINAAAGGGQLDQLKILHMLHQQAMKQSMNESREKQKEEEILKKIQERELKRQQAEKQKEEELQRRREMQIMAEMERERRKQHMILMRALDAHKRYEERERKREEMLVEKRLIQEKKMHKKRIEMELLKELKKPVDDMMLKDLQPLPTLGRISGLKLPGKAFADSLMVYEFLHNFGETLGFDMESLPSLNTLQSSLLNEDDDAEEELLSIVHHLLVCAIDDPGVPVMVTTAMGQKLKDAAITNYDISEILRIYLLSFSLAGREDYSEHKIFNILNTGKQFLSLNATQKAEIISYLCNELMCHQAVMRQVDENIDTIATLRRDKWVIDCESRKYKVIRQRRELLQGINQVKNGADESEGEEGQNGDKQQPLKVDSEAVIDDEESGDSGNENDENQTMINIAINTQFHGHEEEPGMSAEEIDKKIDKLNRQCTMATNKLNKAVNSLRVLSLGQDRFRRRYWILPTSGGVFVEGMESAEPNELAENEAGESMDEEEEEEEDEESETKGADMITENSIEEKVGAESESKEETIQNGDASLVVEEKSEVSENMEESKAEEKQIVKEEKMDTESVNGNKEECNGEDVEKEDTKEEKPGESTWMSPIMASVLAGSMMFGNQGNGVPQFNMPFSKANNSEQTPNQKPWFSILPRMPCSETITISPSKSESHDQEMAENVGDNDASAILLANKDEIVKAAASGNFSNIPPEVLMQAFVYPQVLSSMLKARGIQGAEDSKPKEDSDVSRSASVTPAPSQANVSVDDLDICPSLQRKLIEQKEQQYDEAKKIPALYHHGWWKITEISQVRVLLEALHERGARERQLHKHISKYLSYIGTKCKAVPDDFDANNDEDEDDCEAPSVEDSDSYNHEVGCRLDIAVLEQIESLEEKIANSSMQIRGWKTLPRLSLDTSVTFRHEVKNFPTGLQEEAQDESRNGVDDEISENRSESGTTNPVLVGRQRLLSTEAVIERRYLKPPLGYKNNTVILVTGVDEYAENAADENAPSGLIKWREAVRICTSGAQLALLLHFLESCIAWDKSIMRASCQFCTCGENEAELLLCDGCDRGYHTYCFKPKMAIPEGDWYCYECQNKNTIDKVCIVCGKKGKLLSCDICPKVFHPNCIDPPVTKPSKGRWCCHMCNRTRPRKALPKSTSNSRKGPAPFQSPVAEEKVTKEVLDESEADVETPKSKGKPKGKSKAKKAPKAAEKTEETTSASEDKPVKAEKEKKKSSVGRKGRDKDAEDMAALETLVSEMMNNEEAWPFLKPVPTKQFPTYKKIIKRPMDLTTIKNRLENGTYKTRSDFLADVRLIFDNCETFNEDESPVGRCGHELRKFFEKRWTELFE